MAAFKSHPTGPEEPPPAGAPPPAPGPARPQLDETGLRHLFEVAPFALLLADDSSRIARVNRRCAALLGYTPEELAGQPVDLLVPERHAPGHAQMQRTYWQQPGARPMGGGRDLEARRKDGGTLPVEISLTPVWLEGRMHVLCTLVDVRPRHQLQAELMQSEKLRVVGQLAVGIAHEFNNLLSVILTNASLAAADLPANSPTHELVQSIEQAGRRAAALTGQLLTFSRTHSRHPRRCDVHGVVRRVHAMLAPLMPAGISLRLELSPQPLLAWFDPQSLETIVTNLAINARDAVAERGGRDAQGTITISTALVAERGVELRVEDDGCGMDQEVLSRIFEPFFSTKPVGSGTGLGLSTVYAALENAGGSVAVASTPGIGSIFTVRLPPYEGQASPAVDMG